MRNDSEDADKLLLARSAAGDTDAFRELFERKHRTVYLIAYQILGDGAQAEDVAQEVFLRLWEHCVSYDDRFPVDAWLRRIATNRAIDHWRSRRSERAHPVAVVPEPAVDAPIGAAPTPRHGVDTADPESRFGWRELQEVWDELAAGLPPQQRAAFVLRCIEGLPAAEVADALGCSASTVRSHIAAARKSLRAALAERYPELLAR